MFDQVTTQLSAEDEIFPAQLHPTSCDQRHKIQQSLAHTITCRGIGLHSGQEIKMTLHPAAAHSGITFYRSDVKANESRILARYDHVTDTRLCTKITNESGHSIGTIEHLMSALSALDIDNALIEVNGPEIPVMDGSAKPFVEMIEATGLTSLSVPRNALVVQKKISVRDKDFTASIEPASNLTIQLAIAYDNKIIGNQQKQITINAESFRREIAPARTFGLRQDVETLRANGLALGGSLDNAIVVSDDAVLNEDGLRFADEFVRHKILDCIGDIALAGAPLYGHINGVKTGHDMNNKLLRALFSDTANYSFRPMTASADETQLSKIFAAT